MTYQERIRELTRDPVTAIDAHPVYSKDSFRLAYGSRGPMVQHAPYLGTDGPGELEGAYAIAWFKDGTCRVEHVAMTVEADENEILWLAVERLSRWFPPSTGFPESDTSTSTLAHREPLTFKGNPLVYDLEDADADTAGLGDTRFAGVDDGEAVLPGLPPLARRRSTKTLRRAQTRDSGDAAGAEGETLRPGANAISIEED